MSIVIREGRESDAARMLELLNPIIIQGGWTAMAKVVSLEEQVTFIGKFAGGRGILLVAEENDRIVGMQDVAPLGDGVGEISTFVALDAHRKGIGRKLTDAILPMARARGIKQVRAVIQPSNPAALAFYKAMDFHKIAGGRPGHLLLEVASWRSGRRMS